jgi:uncharacterized protein YecT (DUF1311 family)
MNRTALLVMITFLIPTISSAESLCDGTITQEIQACTEKNFSYSDRVLTENYKSLLSALPDQQKPTLIGAQRNWIKYKEKSCQSAFEATYPGDEAGIDKFVCLNQITRDRARELKLIETGVGSSEFFRAVSVVAKIYENGNENSFIEKLNLLAKSDDNKYWVSYVNKNCDLAVARTHEERTTCIARQYFYRF